MSLGLVKRRAFMLGYKWNTVSGTNNISLPNSMVSNFRNIKILGNSRHKTYAGTNLLDPKLYEAGETINGITIEPQPDGSIIASGTQTGTVTYYLGNYIDLLENGKTYRFSSTSSSGGLNIKYKDGTPNDYVGIVAVDKTRMEKIEPYIQWHMSDSINGSIQAFPAINQGTVIRPWEPATGGKPVTEPSIEFPLEIESCGKIGKNLLDFRTAKHIADIIKPEMLENGIVINGTTHDNRIILFNCNLKAGKTYIMSYKANKLSGNAPSVSCFLPEINQYIRCNKPFVPWRDITKVGIYIDAKYVPSKFEVTDIQLEESNVVTPYEPYSDKYSYDVKVTGKNILSDIGDTYDKFTPFYASKGTKMTLITNGIPSAGGNIKFVTEDGSDHWFAIDAGQTKITRTIYKNVVGYYDVLGRKEGLKYSMVIGDTDKYEPYKEKSVNIPLVTPLAGIGEVKDTFAKDGILRKLKALTITEDLKIYCDLGQYGAVEKNTIHCVVNTSGIKERADILCDRLHYVNNIWVNDIECCGNSQYGIAFRLSRQRLGLGTDTTAEENKKAVMQYITGCPLHFIVELAKPVKESLPPEVQAQLQALHSENGATNILLNSGDVPAVIEATYKMKSN